MSDTITLAALRKAVEADFPDAETRLRRCREAGLIPAGGPGRGGVNSARLTPRDAARALIALSVPCDPIHAPAEAKRIGNFRLRAIDFTHVSDPNPRRQHLDGLGGVTFLRFLTAELEAGCGASPGYESSGWDISDNEATQRWPDRLVFGGLPRNGVQRVTVIPASLVREIGSLFPKREPAEHDEALTAWLDAKLGVDPCRAA